MHQAKICPFTDLIFLTMRSGKFMRRWKTNWRWVKLDTVWHLSFILFFFLTRIQSLVGGQGMNLVLLHGAECQNWNYFAFLFGLHRNLTLQAIQINNYRERTITGGFIYLGFSGSFSIALNASKHSLYNSRIYLGQQRTEEKYKHNIYWTGRVFFLLSLKEFFLP